MSMETGEDSDSARPHARVDVSPPAPHLHRHGGLLEQRYEHRSQYLSRRYPLEQLVHAQHSFSVEIEQS